MSVGDMKHVFLDRCLLLCLLGSMFALLPPRCTRKLDDGQTLTSILVSLKDRRPDVDIDFDVNEGQTARRWHRFWCQRRTDCWNQALINDAVSALPKVDRTDYYHCCECDKNHCNTCIDVLATHYRRCNSCDKWMSCFSCCLTGYGHCEKCSEYCCPTCRDNTCPSCDCEYCPRYLKQGECSGCHQRICNLCPDSRECAKCEKLFCGDPDESGNTGCTALEECDETWGCGKDFCDSCQEEQLVSCRQCNVKKCQDC